MKKTLLFALTAFVLCGCMRKTPVEEAFDSIGQSVVSLEQSLPKECKTDVVMAKISELEAKNTTAQATCETKIQDYKIKYERVLGVLIFVILAFLAKFFIKK